VYVYIYICMYIQKYTGSFFGERKHVSALGLMGLFVIHPTDF